MRWDRTQRSNVLTCALGTRQIEPQVRDDEAYRGRINGRAGARPTRRPGHRAGVRSQARFRTALGIRPAIPGSPESVADAPPGAGPPHRRGAAALPARGQTGTRRRRQHASLGRLRPAPPRQRFPPALAPRDRRGLAPLLPGGSSPTTGSPRRRSASPARTTSPGPRRGAPRSRSPRSPSATPTRCSSRACQGLGIGLHHLPQARNSVAYGGRSQCRACSTCARLPHRGQGQHGSDPHPRGRGDRATPASSLTPPS